jgi:hypothetical protein
MAICVELLSLKATNFLSSALTSLADITAAKSLTSFGGLGLSGKVCASSPVDVSSIKNAVMIQINDVLCEVLLLV